MLGGGNCKGRSREGALGASANPVGKK